jgi:tripartite-type tricarboxylate transporter receptor subunit TctC
MPTNVMAQLSNAALQVVTSDEFRNFANTNVYVSDPKGPRDAKADIDQFSQTYTELLKFIDQR